MSKTPSKSRIFIFTPGQIYLIRLFEAVLAVFSFVHDRFTLLTTALPKYRSLTPDFNIASSLNLNSQHK